MTSAVCEGIKIVALFVYLRLFVSKTVESQKLTVGVRNGFFFLGAKGAGNSACQFSKVGLCFSRLPSTQKRWVFTYKGGGVRYVGLHSKISDFSVKNRNFITKMTSIWSGKAKYYCLKEALTKNIQR